MLCLLNPVDKQAIEAALRLKEAYSANITAITMGPSKSLEVLKEAIALGVDDAAILTDSKFSGSDTCATSRVLAAAVKEKFPDKNIWCYTGFDFEKDVVEKMAPNNETTKELLKYIDVMVDGKFEEEKKDLSLRFRGSSNQRILDVQESLKEHKPVEFKL